MYAFNMLSSCDISGVFDTLHVAYPFELWSVIFVGNYHQTALRSVAQ